MDSGMQTETRHWLLLRGLARESGHWGDFIGKLQAAYPNDTISVIDLPGTGVYHQQASPSSIPAITEIVRDTARQQGLLATPVTVFAVSLGAMVAWQWLQTHPEEIDSAVLVNTSFANLSPVYKRIRWQSFAAFLAVLLQTDIAKRERAIVALVSNRSSHYQQTAEQWTAIQQTHPIRFNTFLRQIIAAARYKPSYNRPSKAVLLLNSLGDRLVSPNCSLAIKNHYQLPMYSHPWAGHDLTLDDSDWVLATLTANWRQ